VRDASGAAVQATVLLGLSPTTTDASGSFAYSELQAGTYQISLQDSTGAFDCREVTLSASNTQFSFELPAPEGGLRAVAVTPRLNADGVAPDSELTLSFSTPVDPASVSTEDFTFTPDIGTFTVAVDGATVTLAPLLQLPLDQLILVEITGTLASTGGAALQHPVRWRFRTASQDNSPPRLLRTTPAADSSGHPPNLAVALEYNEALAEADAGLIVAPTPALTLTVRTSGRSLLIYPEGGWQTYTAYTLLVVGVADEHGNRVSVPYSLSFTTGETSAQYRDQEPEWNYALDVIVFASNRLGSWDIFSITSTGTELTPLTSATGDERHPTLSADGTLLAYQARDAGENWDIYVQELSGAGEPLLVTTPQFNDTEPVFSRTLSNRLTFVSDRSDPRGIYQMNEDGSDLTELDRTFGSVQLQPALHPMLDTQLLFVSNRGGSQDIWRKTVSVIDETTVNINITADLLADEHSPSFSLDASYIVYISDLSGDDNLWTANPTGEFRQQITQFTQPISSPSLSPFVGDMRCVLAMDDIDGTQDLVLVDLIGGDIVEYLTGEEAGN